MTLDNVRLKSRSIEPIIDRTYIWIASTAASCDIASCLDA